MGWTMLHSTTDSSFTRQKKACVYYLHIKNSNRRGLENEAKPPMVSTFLSHP
ncbi:uncharacterized protein G2W53_037606 [Senna tora]|uniref:Uncharacterized protein n=1 Tax=Senna tora TaxID=362788 RepID=A0A834W1C8_9FABA|nr:uncharacterized protein G2W53_037606 [Senna tora]